MEIKFSQLLELDLLNEEKPLGQNDFAYRKAIKDATGQKIYQNEWEILYKYISYQSENIGNLKKDDEFLQEVERQRVLWHSNQIKIRLQEEIRLFACLTKQDESTIASLKLGQYSDLANDLQWFKRVDELKPKFKFTHKGISYFLPKEFDISIGQYADINDQKLYNGHWHRALFTLAVLAKTKPGEYNAGDAIKRFNQFKDLEVGKVFGYLGFFLRKREALKMIMTKYSQAKAILKPKILDKLLPKNTDGVPPLQRLLATPHNLRRQVILKRLSFSGGLLAKRIDQKLRNEENI